jgi:hypothetical protein
MGRRTGNQSVLACFGPGFGDAARGGGSFGFGDGAAA